MTSQGRVSASFASSGCIQEPAFAEDGGRQRRDHAGLPFELLVGQDEHIERQIDGGQCSPGSLSAAVARLGRERDDHQEVVVAILGRIAAGLRAEKIDPLRLKEVDQPSDGLREAVLRLF